jgi:hypothetical protein
MKAYKFCIPGVGLAVIGLLLFHPASVRLVKANTGCTASTIQATYAFAVDGLGASSRNATRIGAFIPVAAAGTFSFDGVGTVSRAFTFSFAGQITSGLADSGTYTVNSDCTGVALFSDVGETFNLVIVSGNEIRFINATPGTVLAGSMTKQRS